MAFLEQCVLVKVAHVLEEQWYGGIVCLCEYALALI
jgi:hypothetical protein